MTGDVAVEWLAGGLLVLLAVVVVGAAMAAYGHRRWQGLTAELQRQLAAGRTTVRPPRYDAGELQGLPAPVQRYFRAVLTDGAPMVGAVALTHHGTFNVGETNDRWRPFRSDQQVVTQRPGFVWNGTIQLLPGLSVHVHDAYVAEEGRLHPALAGLVTLADLRGGGDLATGELMRFLAEAPWYPTALLPSQGVRWLGIDDRAARATLRDGDVEASLVFSFDTEGLVASVRAESRGRTVAGQVIGTPWEGRWSDYQWRDGMRVPILGEAAWRLPGGDKPYWRGAMESARYDFAR